MGDLRGAILDVLVVAFPWRQAKKVSAIHYCMYHRDIIPGSDHIVNVANYVQMQGSVGRKKIIINFIIPLNNLVNS